MPYKRPARILFLATDDRAGLASGYASGADSEWLDPQSCQGPASEFLLHWADLVVTLDTAAQETLPMLPPTARHVHWPVTDIADIQRRIEGMAGGLRMMARHT